MRILFEIDDVAADKEIDQRVVDYPCLPRVGDRLRHPNLEYCLIVTSVFLASTEAQVGRVNDATVCCSIVSGEVMEARSLAERFRAALEWRINRDDSDNEEIEISIAIALIEYCSKNDVDPQNIAIQLLQRMLLQQM
jgi:hypothetical protein